MRILICGSRKWSDADAIAHEFDLTPPDEVVTGDAPGADALAWAEALSRGVTRFRFFANWSEFGRAAGPIRNQKMLDEGVDEVWAFSDDFYSPHSGTRDMCRRAYQAGIPATLFEHDGGRCWGHLLTESDFRD
ncbi:MAG: DUF2493 domain-containing protein [Acidimicrobiaceae bacterium]|nr:DUF2493 domain-containing protein [Acidimicrobiaceae bacterium]